MVHIFLNAAFARDTFTFKFSASPSPEFSFNRPVSLPVRLNRSCKRRRALSDVDGAGNEGRKKRRLRLHLITSRLSRPYSQPATNIVNRGMSKIPVLGSRNGALSKNVLRKAAIMNRVRRRMDAARDFMHTEREKARERLSVLEIILPKPRHLDAPLPPSPLGLSNYDAFDLEDEAREDWDDEEGGSGSKIYSDFNIMNPTSEGNEDGALDDYFDAIDGIHLEDLPDTPPALPEGCIAEMLREDQQGESFFVQVRD